MRAPGLLKRCRRCGKIRSRGEFRTEDRNGVRGWAGRCLSCRRSSHKHGPLWLLADGGPRFPIRPHAVGRYRERCRPGLTFNAARLEMCARMRSAPITHRGDELFPEWLGQRSASHSLHRGMILVDPETVFCLSARSPRSPEPGQIYVSTVLTREGSRRRAVGVSGLA